MEHYLETETFLFSTSHGKHVQNLHVLKNFEKLGILGYENTTLLLLELYK